MDLFESDRELAVVVTAKITPDKVDEKSSNPRIASSKSKAGDKSGGDRVPEKVGEERIVGFMFGSTIEKPKSRYL